MRWKDLWELDCFASTLILAAAFDRQEMEALLGAHPRLQRRCFVDHTPDDFRAFALVHGLCHEKNGASLRIQRRLDRTYADLLVEVEHSSPDELRQFACALVDRHSSRLAGLLWALERADDPELEPTRQFVRSMMVFRGVRGLVFPDSAVVA